MVSFTVTNKATGKGVKGSVTCTAKLAGKPFGFLRRGANLAGQAVCAWRLPRKSSGETLVGTISETFKGVRTSRSFSTKVA